jgi:hypothetical protein
MNYNNSKIKPKNGDIIAHKSSGDHEETFMLYIERVRKGSLYILPSLMCQQGGLHKNARLVANIYDLDGLETNPSTDFERIKHTLDSVGIEYDINEVDGELIILIQKTIPPPEAKFQFHQNGEFTGLDIVE